MAVAPSFAEAVTMPVVPSRLNPVALPLKETVPPAVSVSLEVAPLSPDCVTLPDAVALWPFIDTVTVTPRVLGEDGERVVVFVWL